MKKLQNLLIASIIFLSFSSLIAQDSKFKLFEKSTHTSGFGGMSLNVQGSHFLIGGEGAAVFGNFYFGGFGHSGSLGNYLNQNSEFEYNVHKSSGGVILGGVSNTRQLLALYSDLRIGWDSYGANPIDEGMNLPSFNYDGYSLMPSFGLVIRPIPYMQLRMGIAYNYSGEVINKNFENVPYNAPALNISLNFGRF